MVSIWTSVWSTFNANGLISWISWMYTVDDIRYKVRDFVWLFCFHIYFYGNFYNFPFCSTYCTLNKYMHSQLACKSYHNLNRCITRIDCTIALNVSIKTILICMERMESYLLKESLNVKFNQFDVKLHQN